MITMATPGLLESIIAKAVTPRSDCIIWTGAVDRGYGRVTVDGSAKRVHRVVWELQNGPIDGDLTIDHLCRIRSCINVEHMELVTQSVNASRAIRVPTPVPVFAARRRGTPRAEWTHCPQGHAFDAENTYIRPDGERECRTCRAARDRRTRGALKSA